MKKAAARTLAEPVSLPAMIFVKAVDRQVRSPVCRRYHDAGLDLVVVCGGSAMLFFGMLPFPGWRKSYKSF
ncbi:MAG: hypothetical protein R3C54_11660 [Parvularculaceae bacterium]